MERAARLINKSKLSGQVISDDDLARAIWPAAVGKAIAAHTSRLRLVRATLVVEVEDAIWQRQLFTLTSQIVSRLRKLTGNDLIQDIEFRIGVPRRQPQKAEAPRTQESSLLSNDDSDQIQDPVLKKLYRLSRKKATA